MHKLDHKEKKTRKAVWGPGKKGVAGPINDRKRKKKQYGVTCRGRKAGETRRDRLVMKNLGQTGPIQELGTKERCVNTSLL